MAFHTNSSQQYSLTDITNTLTTREKKAMENSWAKIFAEEIFPFIDEGRFHVLYSTRTQCRSNTPVNICVGALIIKELFQISDDEVVENLMLDPRYQYALHTTSYEEQPLSDKTLSRFRKRCYDYESAYGTNLMHECVADLSSKIAKMMNINPRMKRMDSLMIEANIKNLSRAELLYTCVAKLVAYIHKENRNDILEGLEHYYNPNDFNQTFYYNDSTGTDERIHSILCDAEKLLELCNSDYDEITEYQLLIRCLSEQTVVQNSVRKLRNKEDGGFSSSMLQNPADPDATYREKAGKKHRGYVANFEESVGENGSVVTDYQFEPNTYSDSQFLKDHLQQTESQKETTILITDGAYSGAENTSLAAAKNIRLVTTDLTGKEVPDIYADFEMNKEGTRILKCPAGYSPKSCCCSSSNGHVHASFIKELCLGCPHKDECRVKVYKNVCSVDLSATAQYRAKTRRYMKTDEFKAFARLRNGVETIPSILRSQYQVDRMAVRGKIRSGFFFGCKIAALNVRKLLTFRNGLGHYAQNPLLAS
ncbi:transposase [Kineothrix sedimenti]|uniref:Transposase n=1 Tax=Kineothrix sedimenti TaxID=3123317 RepID=A0ABZ3EU83_9FIRM